MIEKSSLMIIVLALLASCVRYQAVGASAAGPACLDPATTANTGWAMAAGCEPTPIAGLLDLSPGYLDYAQRQAQINRSLSVDCGLLLGWGLYCL